LGRQAPEAGQARRRITLERVYDAGVEELWELWTTRDGIESFWAPEGFRVEVRLLDLRTGGELAYAMTAFAPDQVEFLKKAGMPLTSEHRLNYLEVSPPRRLVYKNLADFIPGVRPYEVTTTLELRQVGEGSQLVLTFDAMHDERWTKLALMGHESELEKLGRLLKAGR